MTPIKTSTMQAIKDGCIKCSVLLDSNIIRMHLEMGDCSRARHERDTVDSEKGSIGKAE